MVLINAVPLLILTAAIIALWVYSYRVSRDGHWHRYWYFRMRRLGQDGRWEYRKTTKDEDIKHLSDDVV